MFDCRYFSYFFQFSVSFDSANRIGALEKLALSKLDLDNNMFTEIREKEGYRTEVVFRNSYYLSIFSHSITDRISTHWLPVTFIFYDNAIDIMEGYIMFCQETLLNHKKIINTKLSAYIFILNYV